MPDALSVRCARIQDAEAVQAIYAPYVAETVISFEETPPTVDEMAVRISGLLDQGYPYIVAETERGIVGYAYAGPHRARTAYSWSVDVSVYVRSSAQGHGVGRKLYLDLLAGLADKNYHAAFAGIALPNPASIALHEALGFMHVGTYVEVGYKFGRWHDVGWWQRLL